MATEFAKFLADHELSANDSVIKMMTTDEEDFSSNNITIGGFIRKLSKFSSQNGGTVLPSEYFGIDSKSYTSNVSSINYSDASPTLTRPALNETFSGGKLIKNPKKYKFVFVKDLKKYFKNPNKTDAANINKLLYKILRASIKNKKITKESLLKKFKESCSHSIKVKI